MMPSGNSWDQILINENLPPVSPDEIITLPPFPQGTQGGDMYQAYLTASYQAAGLDEQDKDASREKEYEKAHAIAKASYSLAKYADS